MPELKDFIVLTLAGGLGCWAWSLMLEFWPPEPDSENAAGSELDSEATPKGD